MKKSIMAILVFLTAVSISAQTTGGESATDITSKNIQAFLNTLPQNRMSDSPIRIVDVGGYHVGVFGAFRTKSVAQESNQHQTKITEIYYMLSGGGTLVTGGKMVGVKPRAQRSGAIPTLVGTGIEGGVSRHIGKGDVVIIPGGVPHWWSSLDSDTTYLITRPDPESQLHLK